MKILNRLRIRSRLMLATIVPVLLTAAVMSWMTASQLKTNGEHEVERLRQQVMEARQEGLKNVVEAARSAVLDAKNDTSLSESQAKEEARDRIRAITFAESNYVFAYSRDMVFLAYRPNPSIEGPDFLRDNPKGQTLFLNLFGAAEKDGFLRYEWLNPASGKTEPKVSYSVVIPGWDWMMGAGVYITDVDQKIEAAREKIDAAVTDAMTLILLVTLVVVVIALILGGFVGQSVTRPLRAVSQTMREIAEGEGDLRQRLPDEGNDELSELGRRFNAFTVKIQNTIREVGVTTEQVASAAEELSSVAGETRASVQEQGSETDQIASAIHEMSATIQQIAGNANSVEAAASDADRLAKDGGETITHAQAAVNALSEEIAQTASNIDKLAEKTDDIQQVLDVIRALTKQTNLLALNAAIEAARAGDHGRGFSVVADEVRQLALRSAQSADQIREMIDGFTAESRGAVERMRASQSLSGETVDRINHATDTLRTIEKSVSQIHDQVTQIATAAEEQSHVSEEINQNVVRIVEAAQRSGTGVTQTTEASQELARLSENLRGLISQFKV